MSENNKIQPLTKLELLQLTQLKTQLYWYEKKEIFSPLNEVIIPDNKNLPSLRDWQLEAIESWFSNNKRGIIKVVTGAGKSIMACGLMNRLKGELRESIKFIIVVPTIILLDQWYTLISQSLNLKEEEIGRLGGGYKDSLDDPIIVLLTVINSASIKLKTFDKSLYKILMIVDECHRSGSLKLRDIFKINPDFTLGLSATPERDETDSSEEDFNSEQVILDFSDSIIGQNLGPIIYELNYTDAIKQNILSPFNINHFGLPFNTKEQFTYDSLSHQISDTRRKLQDSMSFAIDGHKLIGWARKEAEKGNQLASRYVQYISDRKSLVFSAESRIVALLKVIDIELNNNPKSKILIFHEKIDDVMNIFYQLRIKKYSVVVDHSGLTESLRSESLNLFRNDIANILVSARTLIEGFDVPSADVGIIVASSTSVRQRVQTLGRILRKDSNNEEKEAQLYVFYIENSIDTRIYQKINWDEIFEKERNRYYTWNVLDEYSQPLLRDNPPAVSFIQESNIDFSNLKIGELYPGEYTGQEYEIDKQGNLKDSKGYYDSKNIIELLEKFNIKPFVFKVTPLKKAIISRNRQTSEVQFLGFFSDIKLKSENLMNSIEGEWLEIAKHKGVLRIKKKVKNGFDFAKTTQTANDKVSGEQAELLIKKIIEINTEKRIDLQKIFINNDKNVFAYLNGEFTEIFVLEANLEFP
jgi:superfamily II DNA or RNA helicase